MKNQIRNTLYIILFIVVGNMNLLAQGPPAPAMPNEVNTKIVDSIIQVTHHEKYFIDYCTQKVNEYADKNNWTKKKRTEVLERIDFETYRWMVYNPYACYSTEQLTTLLNALRIINAGVKESQGMIVSNEMMQDNLERYVQSILER